MGSGEEMVPVDNCSLQRWRTLGCETIIERIAEYAKRDPDFHPLKDSRTTRWYASVQGQQFELLITGTKFWDPRHQKGGGGAVDLVMHLRKASFREAAVYLKESRI